MNTRTKGFQAKIKRPARHCAWASFALFLSLRSLVMVPCAQNGWHKRSENKQRLLVRSEVGGVGGLGEQMHTGGIEEGSA